MRMQKTDLEFIVFDSRDVIMTSSRTQDTTSIVNIWLTKGSVNNFNSYKTDDNNLNIDYALPPGGVYFAFTPNNILVPGLGYLSVQSRTDTPTEGLYTVGKNDAYGYKAVLDWITGNTASGQ